MYEGSSSSALSTREILSESFLVPFRRWLEDQVMRFHDRRAEFAFCAMENPTQTTVARPRLPKLRYIGVALIVISFAARKFSGRNG